MTDTSDEDLRLIDGMYDEENVGRTTGGFVGFVGVVGSTVFVVVDLLLVVFRYMVQLIS